VTVSVQDPYRILHVEPNASLETIRAAYRRLARAYHPDLNPRPEAVERMRAINAAYAVLSDQAQRAAYDAQRYLRRARAVRTSVTPQMRPVVITTSNPPTQLQRQVDRAVAVVGIVLLIAIAFYTVNVIPYAEQQYQAQRSGAPLARPTTTAIPQSATTDHTTSPAIPDRLSRDNALKNFPGTVLVAPSNLEPFASLPILRTEAASQGIAGYDVYYGDLTSAGAIISGLIGRVSFDAGTARLPDCNPDGTYCSGPVPGQSSGALGLELFRTPGLVGDDPAYATHRVCCNGVFWTLSWYEPRSNMSYSIEVSRSAAAHYGRPVAEANVDAARAFAALAPQLVRLP
jgi:DnaJ domain